MKSPFFGRFICTLLIALTGTVAVSCGSSGAGTPVAGGDDASVGGSGGDGSLLFQDSGSLCVPGTCKSLGYTCGGNGDGCGGTLACGTCTAPEYCGGGGYSQCGGSIYQGADGGQACTPKTCTDLGYTCGPSADGCGLLVQCGTCTAPDFCGGGGFDKCGGGDGGTNPDGGPRCTPKTCANLGYNCGAAGDGCGGTLDCGTCTAPQFCGGGGFNLCGGHGAPDGGPVSPCVPATCQSLVYNCGAAGDGCGGLLDCGTCSAPQFCGGGGFDKCGGNKPADGGVSSCTPRTCANLGYNCGPAADGCGGLLQCGTCVAPQFCGGRGFDLCGGNSGFGPDGGPISTCTPKTCPQLGFNCGPAGDGCGGTLQCGTCTAPQSCGGGGAPSVCGGNTGIAPDGAVICTPATCASLGFNCGSAGDGCGGTLQCGSTCATSGDICGGGGQPNVCGQTIPCTGLCQNQVSCDGGALTTITGKILAGVSAWLNPAQAPDPVPNVLVYVRNAPLQGFSTGAACRQCSSDVSGSPLVSTHTNFDGTFTLPNVPAGVGFPLVIQLGRWRREFPISAVTACTTADVGSLHMPRNQGEGNIPFSAISTGNVDPLECVLLKMGIDQTEFTPDSGTGRIHVYGGGTLSGGGSRHGPGATAGAGTRQEAALLDTGGTYMNYDQIMLPCWGSPTAKTAGERADLITYADGGGHFFATHYSYSWLVGNGEFDTVASWNPDYNNPGNVSWTLDVNKAVPPSPPAPTAGTFASWLNLIGALSNSGPTLPANPQVSISNPRHDADGVANGSIDWIDGTDPDHNNSLVEHFTFDTPVGGSPTCGHAIFSDFHVAGIANGPDTNGQVFPAECTKSFTPQEKILEFMIWDLASCVVPSGPTCTPRTCQQMSSHCGPTGDGCGNLIPGGCGTCTAPQTCGGGGVASQCGYPDAGACVKQTCAGQNIGCGPAGDGCGGLLDCGTCTAPLTCGGGGVPGQCGVIDAGSCLPRTCPQQNIACGPAGDGCGSLISGGCGSCPTGQTCGGGGVPGHCGAPDGGTCTPQTCAQQNIACGPAGDGCGNQIPNGCGTCPAGQTCGGGGVAGHCGTTDGSVCAPQTCAQQSISCGPAGDGCGNLIPGGCGKCTPPQTCGGGGVPGKCGGTAGCVPETCAQQGITCGPAGDGCGNLIAGGCGVCTPPQTCGGGGTAGVCGGNGACTPQTCQALGYNCGPAGDGCGGLVQCGSCTIPQSCGGGGTPGVCGGGTQ